MAKKGMKHPDVTRGPRNETSPVPQIQGQKRQGKSESHHCRNQRRKSEGMAQKAHIQGSQNDYTFLARANLENDISFADLQNL